MMTWFRCRQETLIFDDLVGNADCLYCHLIPKCIWITTYPRCVRGHHMADSKVVVTPGWTVNDVSNGLVVNVLSP